ncbi:WD40 repeat-containing protein, putative, partial [Bodo saltans]
MRSAQGNTNVTPLATTTTTTAGHTPFPIDATLHSNDSINSVAFSPDGTLLAMGSSDNTTKLWRVADGVCTATLVSHSNSSITCVYCVAFSPDGTLLATTNYDNTTKLWRVADGVCRVTLKGHKRAVLCVAFSPDGMLLATGSAENTLKFWRVADGKCTATLGAHSNTVRSVAFSPDGTLLATGGWDSCTKLWRVADHVLMEILDCPSSYVMSVAFSPDGKLLAAGGGQATRLWRVDYDSCTATLTATLEGYSVTTVAFSPDGKVLATGSSFKTTKLWRVAGGACTATLEGHSESVSSVAFSPDGALLATGSNDKTTNLWRLKGARNNIVPKRSAPVFPHVKLGDLSIGDTIGGGSSGVVLKCKWKGQTCALKQYHPNIVRKIEREVVVAPHLQHPNIVSVVAIVDSSDGGAQTVGLLMEIAAKSLGDLLELSERPPQATILQWLHEAAQGIEFAHQCRVVHSDIKPDNIMTVLDQKLGTVAKVSDFGSATSRDTFDHVLEALPRVPRHLPIAVCGNFWDLVHEDKERLEVDEKDVEKLLKLVAHRAVTPLFASF